MPNKLRPPCRVEQITIPSFGMSWYVDPGNGRSILAYAGGGGSARTGVNNAVVIQEDDEVLKIPTETKVGLAVLIYQHPTSRGIWLLVSLGDEIRRYKLPEGEFDGGIEMPVDECCDAVAVTPMGDALAAGCSSGLIYLYEISDDEPFGKNNRQQQQRPLYSCVGHEKSVCGLAFAPRGGRDLLLSSAKDGTARVWNGNATMGELKCEIPKPDPAELAKQQGKKKKRHARPDRGPGTIVVRGCAFGDLDGKVIYAAASGRRGNAYMYKWKFSRKDQKYKLRERTVCSEHPISAMSMSADATRLALGNTDGAVILWDLLEWHTIRVFAGVHDLPVTSIAVRPYPVPLQGEEDGIRVDVRTASADSRMGCLTLQRKVPKKYQNNRRVVSSADRSGALLAVHRLISLIIVGCLLYPVYLEGRTNCDKAFLSAAGGGRLSSWGNCILDDVLIAPSWRPGVVVPPY